MTDYYIATMGDDTTGDGSSGAPWKTFTKAMIVAIASDTIYAADGVYQENTSTSGYWRIAANLANWLTIQPTSGAAGDVTITAASGTNRNSVIYGTSSHLRFKWIKFGVLAGSQYNFRFDAAATYIDFQYCTFTNAETNGGAVYTIMNNLSASNITFLNCTMSVTSAVNCINLSPAGTGTFAATFTDCTVSAAASRCLNATVATIVISGGTWTMSGTGNFNVIRFGATAITLTCTKMTVVSNSTSSGGAILSDDTDISITLINCIVTAVTSCVAVNGGIITIINGKFTTSGNYKVMYFGVDGETGGLATIVSVYGGVLNKVSGTNHAMLMGNGATGTIDGMIATKPSGDYGIVVKENTGVTIKNCKVYSGTTAALYLKVATSAVVQNNILVGNGGGHAFQLAVGDTGHTNSGCTITGNRLFVYNNGNLFAWETAGDGGNNICDLNHYRIYGTGNFGTVRASTNISNLSALFAAWAGYTNPNNDLNSKVYNPLNISSLYMDR